MKLINSTQNGQIFFCSYHNIIHLEFGNLFLHFSYDEIVIFTEYVNSIDYKFYLVKNQNSQNRRKLLLHIGSKNAFLAVTLHEFLELKDLLTLKRKPTEINNNQIIIDKINLN